MSLLQDAKLIYKGSYKKDIERVINEVRWAAMEGAPAANISHLTDFHKTVEWLKTEGFTIYQKSENSNYIIFGGWNEGEPASISSIPVPNNLYKIT